MTVAGDHISAARLSKKGYLSVDHCHVTGKVRGLVCQNCNSMLGYAKDEERRLEMGIEYLKKHGAASC